MKQRAEMTFAILLFAVFVLPCAHVEKAVKAIPDNAATIHLSPQVADLVRKVAVHSPELQGFTVGRWGTVFLIPADQVSAYLACHESHHIEQFSAYDDDAASLEAYAGAFVGSTVAAAIHLGRTELLFLVMQIVRGQVDAQTLAVETGVGLLRAGYLTHPWELEANQRCQHLR